MAFLLGLSDDLLLKIFQYLGVEDLANISATDDRLKALTTDRDVCRRIILDGEYLVQEDFIRFLLMSSGTYVRCLDLNHCYWFSSRFLQWTMQKCRYLRELHVLECRVQVKQLVNTLTSLSDLTALSFSVSTFSDLKKDMFTRCSKTLEKLKRLRVYYASREMSTMSYLGEQDTLLDYCVNLEELIIGSAGMAVPELYRPVIGVPLSKLKVMVIANNIHAGALMMFYGTLSQLPNSDLKWRTLLMPNVNFIEFAKKAEFIGCLKNIDNLVNLDVSGSKVFFPNEIIDLTKAVKLQHLCLNKTSLKSQQLLYIGVNCVLLDSISFFGCPSIFQGDDGLDLSGIEAIFNNCVHLKRLNIAGEHHHLYELPQAEVDKVNRVFSKMKGLRRFAIPVCLLCDYEVDSPSCRRRKRLLNTPREAHIPLKRSKGTRSYMQKASISDATNEEPSPTTSSDALESPRPVLDTYADNNPDLEELEIIAVNFHSAFHKNKYVNSRLQQFSPCVETRLVGLTELEPIRRFTKLQSLTLIGTPRLVSGECLVKIAKSCPMLNRLSIGYLGGAMYGNHFSHALTLMHQLKDLRIEQPHLYLNPPLFEGLSQCRSLQRLCIIAKHSAFKPNLVFNLFESLPRLTVVQLFSGATLTACKNLTTQLIKKYSKSRPSLSITIHPLMHEALSQQFNSIPAKHLCELTRFHSRITSEPPDLENKI